LIPQLCMAPHLFLHPCNRARAPEPPAGRASCPPRNVVSEFNAKKLLFDFGWFPPGRPMKHCALSRHETKSRSDPPFRAKTGRKKRLIYQPNADNIVDMSTFTVLDAYSALRREISLVRSVELKALDFGYKQMVILYRLTQGNCAMGELAEYTQSDKASATRAVESLESAGWVKRIADPADRRKIIIELTARGRQKAAKAIEIRDHIGERVNATLNANEQKELSRLLNKVVEGLQEIRK
jgi:DNA-binding MarR family transcriptional regulator